MFQLNALVRPNIQSLQPYQSARDDFKSDEGFFYDANENPYGHLNRYPDPRQNTLKETLSSLKNIPRNNIFIGNGSDEAIDILIRIFCCPNKDKIIICPPTYGMYKVSAHINHIDIITVPLTETFELNIPRLMTYGHLNNDSQVKLIFLCSPNNPTGNSLNNIDTILKSFKGIVVIDEAYIDFSNKTSYSQRLNEFPNMVVLQTLSKAWGMAAARIGIAMASEDVISFMNNIKPPYNISKLNQVAALKALQNTQRFQKQIDTILKQKQWLCNQLSQIKCITKYIPPMQILFWLKLLMLTEFITI